MIEHKQHFFGRQKTAQMIQRLTKGMKRRGKQKRHRCRQKLLQELIKQQRIDMAQTGHFRAPIP